MSEKSITKKRALEFDCLKWFAMLSVVVSHFANLCVGDSAFCRIVFIYTYAFHMPLFIFLSGLFNRKRTSFPIDSVVFFVVVSLLIRFLSVAEGLMFSPFPAFHLWGDGSSSWFLIALAIWISLAYVFQNANPILVVCLSIVFGCAVCFDPSLGDTLAIMRTFVFAPFYFIGFFLTPDWVLNTFKSKLSLVFGSLIVVGFAIVCILELDAIYLLRPLFTGRNPYSAITAIESCGIAHRLLCYFISGLLVASFVALFCHMRFQWMAKWGTRTLGIYCFQEVVVMFLYHSGVMKFVTGLAFGHAIWLGIGVIACLVLSNKAFSAPLTYIKKNLAKP